MRHSAIHVLTALLALAGSSRAARAQACYATASSMTPIASRAPTPSRQEKAPASGLRLVEEIPLPGPANRFDYQSFDPSTNRIYMNHMDAGRTIVFDVAHDRVLTEIAGVPRATGVWAVPSHHQVYISAAGARGVAIVDDRTLKIVSHVAGIRFPDGIAYAPNADKVFVSDESGGADVVIDPAARARRSTIALGGEAGNTHYDSVSHCILVAVQTRNQMVAIDPMSETIVQRYDLPGSDHPHGFTIDEPDRLAFVSCEGNATLLVVDLRTMKPIQRLAVGDDPDVLAWDPGLRRLYVASESGVLSAFWLNGTTLRPIGDVKAPHAHTVSVDPKTHRVYVPLENVGGRPVLRIYEPMPTVATPTSELNSASAAVRAHAFYELVAAAEGQPRGAATEPKTNLLAARATQQDDLARALISLLDRENALLDSARVGRSKLPRGFDGEGYYIDLAYTVAGLHQERALHALIPVIDIGQPMQSSIAAFGEAAVPYVLTALNDTVWTSRLGAIRTLDKLVKGRSTHSLTDGSLATIRDNLLAVAGSKTNYLLRVAAIQTLDSFSGEDIRATMEHIASTEPRPARPRLAGAMVISPAVAASEWLAHHPKTR